jgi:hypothetical protein
MLLTLKPYRKIEAFQVKEKICQIQTAAGKNKKK